MNEKEKKYAGEIDTTLVDKILKEINNKKLVDEYDSSEDWFTECMAALIQEILKQTFKHEQIAILTAKINELEEKRW